MIDDPAGFDGAAAEFAATAGPAAKVVERPSPLTGLARAAISLGAGAFLVIREVTEHGGFGGNLGPLMMFCPG